MQEHFHFTEKLIKLQNQLITILQIVRKEITKVEGCLQRKNRHLLKRGDAQISVYIF
jgi:hypothetical protein